MRELVMQCVYVAIDEANDDRQDLPPLEKSLDTPLHGTSSGLDSLGLITPILLHRRVSSTSDVGQIRTRPRSRRERRALTLT